MRWPRGPPSPGPSPVPACSSVPRYIRGTPSRAPARSPVSPTYDGGRTCDARGTATHGCTRQKSPRVSGSSATTTSSTSSRSAIVRVWGTTTSMVGTSGQLPRMEITPREGV